jgi:hypothetical protein
LQSWLQVRDSLVVSDTSFFQLNGKGSSFVDTLTLHWLRTPRPGTDLYRLTAEGHTIAHFGARSFPVECDTARSVAVLTGRSGSSVVDALRRLGMRHVTACRDSAALADQLPTVDAVIIDRLALSLVRGGPGLRERLLEFATKGGTVVILGQDPTTWNGAQWWSDVRLVPSTRFPESVGVTIDSTAPLATMPNRLTEEDFRDWMFRRAYDAMEIPTVPTLSAPMRAPDGSPLAASQARGRGMIVYTNLALGPQWQNIHPGSFRILANLIAGGRR